MQVIANGIRIEVDDTGGAERPVAVLIMGLGMQLIGWPDAFVSGLVGQGFRVIRLDNRDSGLSEGFEDADTGNFVWQTIRHRMGLPVRSAYRLQDMAGDVLGVLDALGIARANIIGASMGGMVAQHVAAMAPDRTMRLVSIMSSSGARGLPGPSAKIASALLRRPRGRSEQDLVAHSVEFVRLISSPAYRQDDADVKARITQSFRRAYRPDGLMRQMLAIAADSRRPELLSKIASPTLVIHGEADGLVPIACGIDTARRITGARFVSVPGMGHDLPPRVVEILLREINPFLSEVE